MCVYLPHVKCRTGVLLLHFYWNESEKGKKKREKKTHPEREIGQRNLKT